ncbi:T9SS C-terminal target domain-containing protein [Belliella aquatica]|uniref:T9SS type A sorting domain-containing protein n=1 Tax=Belliella aquatica TaxID=1323734 RepID=A0ABQ1MJX3_9BACT|nr:T9SS C-terminal target domain-containing protein [Belliella aquatica]MCH7405451.1 T9SS C-terminal target domain-containing protein [Belliella aquatica]GGC41504.1 hypothetical protein GCM10010993_20150 [Belliella aquatica]
MLTNFLIKKISVLLITLLLCASISIDSFGQSCPECVPTRAIIPLGNSGTVNSPTPITVNNPSNQIFQFTGNGFFSWSTNSTITLRGIVLDPGVYMTLGTANSNGNNDAFKIAGTSATDRGCITVKNGATLNLAWISELQFVDVCVEDGGKIIFDSENAKNGGRNEYTFDGVLITLAGPNAQLNFGDAKITIDRGLDIVGWTGDQVCDSASADNPSSSGQSGNISWNSETANICAILNFGILPVEYLSFTANHNSLERSNEINWVTASEKNNSHFIIQRSINDIKSWEDLGEVNGAINSDMPIAYDFTDSFLPLAGGNIYYRLKQVDLEGKSSLSEVISVRVGGMSGKGTWRVFPNPINGEAIRLELLSKEKYKGEDVSIRLLSNYNSLENKQIVTKDIFDLSNQLQQLLQPLGKGVAVLEIIWGNQVEHIKILKK